MERQVENKIVLVRRKTRLEELIARFNTVAQAKFYIERLGADFSDYVLENENYHKALHAAQDILKDFGRLHVIDRFFLPNFIFSEDDLVVAIGQDGMVANTLKYLNRQTLIGVNPDPLRWDGVLLPFKVKDLRVIVPEALKKLRPIKEISMAKATLNDGQKLYAVNDLFIGPKTHVSARYQITLDQQTEFQSSSGIIVSTGLGSTGWFKSIITGAVSIAKNFENSKKNEQSLQTQIKWDSNFLYFSVREPFPSKSSTAKLVFGKIIRRNPLKIVSQMPENGVIFSDGIESDFLAFNSGIEATITLAEKKGRLAV